VLQDARLKLETTGLEHDALMQNGKGLVSEMENIQTELLRDVAPFGVEQIPATGFDALLKNLTERKDIWRAKQDEKAAWEKKISDQNAAMEKEKALLSKLETDLAEMRRDRDILMRGYESLNASRIELFAKDTNVEEKRLADAVNRADLALEARAPTLGPLKRYQHSSGEDFFPERKNRQQGCRSHTGGSATHGTHFEGRIRRRRGLQLIAPERGRTENHDG